MINLLESLLRLSWDKSATRTNIKVRWANVMCSKWSQIRVSLDLGIINFLELLLISCLFVEFSIVDTDLNCGTLDLGLIQLHLLIALIVWNSLLTLVPHGVISALCVRVSSQNIVSSAICPFWLLLFRWLLISILSNSCWWSILIGQIIFAEDEVMIGQIWFHVFSLRSISVALVWHWAKRCLIMNNFLKTILLIDEVCLRIFIMSWDSEVLVMLVARIKLSVFSILCW